MYIENKCIHLKYKNVIHMYIYIYICSIHDILHTDRYVHMDIDRHMYICIYIYVYLNIFDMICFRKLDEHETPFRKVFLSLIWRAKQPRRINILAVRHCHFSQWHPIGATGSFLYGKTIVA